MKRRITRAVTALHPKRIKSSLNQRRTVQDFADKFGLVFFGSVNQHDEDQKVVRGITVSHAHHDQYYLIGTVDNYDVVFVERSDTIVKASRKTKLPQARHSWHIFQFDLQSPAAQPMIFIANRRFDDSYSELIRTKHAHLRAVPMTMIHAHDNSFLHHYRVMTAPTHFMHAEEVLTPEITKLIASHFGHFAIEIHGRTLLLYSERARLSTELLRAMLHNGIWLAKTIDAQSNKHQASDENQT